jgi:glycosyltransferase involved in cell wall biosynthesis
LKIAIVGTRGIPNRYGGFERFAEQVSSRFADHVPSVHQKHLDTWVSTAIAAVRVAFSDADVVLICNVANSPFALVPRLLGKPVILNVDGLDRKREKWKGLGAAVLHFCEWLSSFSSTRLVTDAKAIHDYYLQKYRSESTIIGYGSEMPAGDYNLNGFNFASGQYVLYVSRLEPENNPELVLRAWRQVQTDWPLVIVGDNRYDARYIDRLTALADKRVVFTGAVYDQRYWALQKHAGVFVFACEIGGVHPALIEAMAAENAVLVLDTPENNETAGDAAVRYIKSEDDLGSKLQALLDDPAARREMASRAKQRADSLYRWEAIAGKYEKLFAEVSK